jgi:hypothetical protein
MICSAQSVKAGVLGQGRGQRAPAPACLAVGGVQGLYTTQGVYDPDGATCDPGIDYEPLVTFASSIRLGCGGPPADPSGPACRPNGARK